MALYRSEYAVELEYGFQPPSFSKFWWGMLGLEGRRVAVVSTSRCDLYAIRESALCVCVSLSLPSLPPSPKISLVVELPDDALALERVGVLPRLLPSKSSHAD